MLTVREVLGDLDVRLLAGEENLDVPVRWVHISELADPTPWLSGGELLLTTGMALDSPTAQRDFIATLADHGKAPDTFPNALATMWCYITDDRDEADRILKERVVPTVHRPEDMLRDRLPIGPPDLFAEKLTAFAKAGVQRVFIWPVANELHQLERFWNDVRPLVAGELGGDLV